MAARLRAIAQLGMYFQLTPVSDTSEPPIWGRLSELYSPDGAGELLRLVDDVRGRIGNPERRVAASILHLGLAARLWSPLLGAAALSEDGTPALVRLPAEQMRWAMPPGSGMALRLDDARAWQPADTAAAVLTEVLDGHLAPFEQALAQHVTLASGLLRGNAASALVGSLRVLSTAQVPNLVAAEELAMELLAQPALRETGAFALRPLRFRRTSCCLYYRVPGGGLCGDCVLDKVPGG
ncbi:ferric iron reductase [Pseudonocardiaceae bacterium YIM PH 21723]|nr:ferric iron reductase [Pseudonocardiaceae bacterium YIM PH 21723]